MSDAVDRDESEENDSDANEKASPPAASALPPRTAHNVTDAVPDSRKRKLEDPSPTPAAVGVESIPKLPVSNVVRFLDLNAVSEAVWKACVTLETPFQPEGKCRIAAVRFNADRFNSSFADGVTVPRYMPLNPKQLAFRSPWLSTPFGYDPVQDPNTKNWITVLRLTFDDCPDPEQVEQYKANVARLRDFMAQTLMTPVDGPGDRVLISTFKEYDGEGWKTTKPELKDIVRVLTPPIRSAKQEGFSDYQKVSVMTQRADAKRGLAADHSVTVNVEAYDMADLTTATPLSRVTKDHFVQAGMILKHIALQSKIPLTFELRQVKYGLKSAVLSKTTTIKPGCAL